ncbi:MAG: NAD-dependent epimerase/dehydratase family protein [Acidobacteria bacterium]|nr:NAD-dependent epimerase/dehydratase family protein [Acidobacteriota bacterium]
MSTRNELVSSGGGSRSRTLVTGGTGFVGAHLVRALLGRGAAVRCLVRPAGPPGRRVDLLAGLPVEIAAGDLRDPASLRAAVAGCDAVYHCAADYRLFTPDPAEMIAANVTGTDNLLAACAAAGVSRVVYTSSVGALGLAASGKVADERTPVTLDAMIGPYKRSKYQAERVAEQWAARGLPLVIVNPSTPVGEGDVKPTPTGQMVVDFLRRKFPAYVDTGLNLIDVRDVAQGHLLAADKGRPGERYILGNRNMTLKEILDTLARLTGLPSPRLRVPHWLPLAAAHLASAAAGLTGKPPRVTPEAVRMSRHRMFFDAGKAVRELGLPQSPVDAALERAVAWFKGHGYVPQPLPRREAAAAMRSPR